MLRNGALLLTWSALLIGCLSGCARFGPGTTPAWVDGTSREYPPDRYLLGVGQADSRPNATERAYAEVAKIFKAEISAQSKDWESFLVLETKGQANTERRLTLDQVTRVSTDKILENVRVLAAWLNARTGQHYVLAGMDRAQAETAMTERLTELDRTVDTELTEARQTRDPLTRVRHLKRAIKDLIMREAYNADLRVIRSSGRGVEPPYRVAELTGELEQFLNGNLVIGVEVTGEQSEPVRRALIEGLLREGLPVTGRPIGSGSASPVESGKPLELLVRGTAQVWDLTVPDPQFRYVRWCSDFVIVEIGTQRIVGAVSKGGREGHLTAGEARAKALRVMQQELTSELAKTLADYVYGETEPPAGSPPSACPRGDDQRGPRSSS